MSIPDVKASIAAEVFKPFLILHFNASSPCDRNTKRKPTPAGQKVYRVTTSQINFANKANDYIWKQSLEIWCNCVHAMFVVKVFRGKPGRRAFSART
jgi:hypothetical protein